MVCPISRAAASSASSPCTAAPGTSSSATYSASAGALQTALEEKSAALQKDLEVMGPEERENAQRDLRNEERAIVRAQTEFREDLDLRNNEAIGKIQQDVLREISAYATSAGFDLVAIGECRCEAGEHVAHED